MPQDEFDLLHLRRRLPADLPFKPTLFINPPQNSVLRVNGTFSNTANARVSDSLVTRDVNWSNVHVREAKYIDPPQWARTLVEVDGGPLVIIGDTGVRRVGAITFDLHDSDLPLQVTFPILLVNLINYLAPGQSFDVPDGVAPGSSVIMRPIRVWTRWPSLRRRIRSTPCALAAAKSSSKTRRNWARMALH